MVKHGNMADRGDFLVHPTGTGALQAMVREHHIVDGLPHIERNDPQSQVAGPQFLMTPEESAVPLCGALKKCSGYPNGDHNAIFTSF